MGGQQFRPFEHGPTRMQGQCHQGEARVSALSIGCQDNKAISSTRREQDLVTTPGQGRGNTIDNARMSEMTEEMKGNVFPAETSKFGRCLPLCHIAVFSGSGGS